MGLTEKECWFWLCSRPWLGVRSIDKLLGYFKTAKNIYYGRNTQYAKVQGLKEAVRKKLENPEEKDESQLKRVIRRLEILGGRFAGRIDEEYPEKLRHIYDAPAGLFYYGDLPDSKRPAIAIVGAREASGYGLASARYFARALSEMGIDVISGLARGIDGEAHRGVLQEKENGEAGKDINRGKTWGVLGCGLNICYPRENYGLFETMKFQGGILSEYGLDVKPEPWRFPMRNRIISGLSDGIFVIEARERSGALITAEMGLEQGKNVYALPGRFNDSLSHGCLRLIQSGAKLVFKPEDIAEDYDISGNCLGSEQGKRKLSLDNSEQLVYASLSLSPKDVDTISAQCGLTLSETWKVLVNLELEGWIRPMGKNLYIRSI